MIGGGCMRQNYLAHHGVKGMKWGVRRYQNKDGTLTPAGKKRADRDMADLSPGKKKQYSPNSSKWVREDMERSKKLVDANSSMVNQLKSANNTSINNQPKTKMDLSNMTDKELRDQINRAFLEKQYNDLFNQPAVPKGREYATKILETSGTVLAIGSSALGIALAIKDLRG